MLLIKTEEGEVFDKIAIINVKLNLTNGAIKEKNLKNLELLAAQVKEQIGVLKYNEIMDSDEYRDLYEANLDVFKVVESAQKGHNVSAKDTDFKNYQRFLKKSALQKKYFDSEVKEVKIGYID